MQLSEANKLNIKDPITKYITELPEWANQITIQHLLQYTSGLPCVSCGKHKIFDGITLFNDVKNIETLEFMPGSNYLYTNYSLNLLSEIVEHILNTTFINYVTAHILKPNGMKDSGFNDSLRYKNKTGMALTLNENNGENFPPFQLKSPVFLFHTTTTDLFFYLTKLHIYSINIDESLAQLVKLPIWM